MKTAVVRSDAFDTALQASAKAGKNGAGFRAAVKRVSQTPQTNTRGVPVIRVQGEPDDVAMIVNTIKRLDAAVPVKGASAPAKTARTSRTAKQAAPASKKNASAPAKQAAPAAPRASRVWSGENYICSVCGFTEPCTAAAYRAGWRTPKHQPVCPACSQKAREAAKKAASAPASKRASAKQAAPANVKQTRTARTVTRTARSA